MYKVKSLKEMIKELGGDPSKLPLYKGTEGIPRVGDSSKQSRPSDHSVKHPSIRAFTRDFEDYDGDDLTYVFAFMGDWFKLNAPTLDNMDGKDIAKNLNSIYVKLKQRLGN